jgi:LmbE family N-acetylglucosaminyl deacetylase
LSIAPLDNRDSQMMSLWGKMAYDRLEQIAERLLSKLRRQPNTWLPTEGPVVVLAPHPDDEVIGCGGTLRKHVLSGHRVTVIYLTRGEKSCTSKGLSEKQRADLREKEARASCAVLGISDAIFLNGRDMDIASSNDLESDLLDILESRRPRVLYIPHVADNHIDHQAAHSLAVKAIRCVHGQPECLILGYEIWSPLRADCAVDITHVMPSKIRAIRCHRSQLLVANYVAMIKPLAFYRARTMLSRDGYAEAFERYPSDP